MFISKTGSVKAEIKVNTVIVEGEVNGNITATELVDLRSTARLFGDIKAEKLIVAEGVVFVGKCDVNPSK